MKKYDDMQRVYILAEDSACEMRVISASVQAIMVTGLFQNTGFPLGLQYEKNNSSFIN